MNESNTLTCPKCNTEYELGQAFCESCGEQFSKDRARLQVNKRKKIGSLAQEQHKKHIRGARIAIMVVSILTIGLAAFSWHMLDLEIAKIESDPNMIVQEDVVQQNRLIFASIGGVGLIFFFLFFWAKTNPFGASLTALIILSLIHI